MIETLSQQKTLPHSEESERAVLAGVLLDPRRLALVAGRLVADDFYFDRHRILYQAMIDLQMKIDDISNKIDDRTEEWLQVSD